MRLDFQLGDVTDDKVKLSFLACNLEGRALSWLLDYAKKARTSQNSKLDYDRVIADFRSYFRIFLNSFHVYEERVSLRQTGSLTAYSEKFKKWKFILDEDMEISEMASVHQYVVGLKPKIKKLVREQEPKTLSEAIIHARAASALETGDRTTKSSKKR
ncbi:LAME_0F01728g1_1 [Lachancea meyersii CBS 8951]|uniref:LAME_0F01728g1_1 n=1 Tax=Lachancea meyersii CBS 8951 TaxID=1266667 RepID=A0A1G4JQ05_9SACH|nr:LAME_0F01728g1_1 [Lachancea meyersii CBS 8951]